jgi:hypothetical protein
VKRGKRLDQYNHVNKSFIKEVWSNAINHVASTSWRLGRSLLDLNAETIDCQIKPALSIIGWNVNIHAIKFSYLLDQDFGLYAA